MHSPFRYLMLNGVSKGQAGAGTTFVPLEELVSAQHAHVRRSWEGLWMETRTGAKHPLVYKHPATGHPTMALHMHEHLVSSFVRPGAELRIPGKDVFADLDAAIDALGMEVTIEWEAGDLIIVDNMAVAHRAPDDGASQLRILDHIDIFDDTMRPTAAFAYSQPNTSKTGYSDVLSEEGNLSPMSDTPGRDELTRHLMGADLLAENMKLFYSFYSSGDPCSCYIAVPTDIMCPSGMSCVTVSSNETLKGQLSPTTNNTLIEQCCKVAPHEAGNLSTEATRLRR
jgi:hypothetical protein